MNKQMRSLLLLLMLILFSCQKESANLYRAVNLNQNVESVKMYMVVPKTNPDYWTEPKGLMLISEDFFDEKGRMVKTFCRECDVASHSPSFDVVTKYYYDAEDLIKIHKEGRDTVDTDVKYFKSQKVKVEYLKSKDSCIGINYVILNGAGDEIRRINLDFSYFNELNSFNVGYLIIDTEFSNNKKKANFNRGQFALNKSALVDISTADLNKLQIIEADYYKKFMEYKGNHHDMEVVSTYKNGELTREETRYFGYYKDRVDSVLYFYNLEGLLVKRKVRYGVFDGEYKYVYKYRK